MTSTPATVEQLDALINNVDMLRNCVFELSAAVRNIVDCKPDAAVLGKLDAIDHVLRTLPL